MVAWWLILAGMGLCILLWLYDRVTTKEVVENATVRGRSHREPLKARYFLSEGGSSFLYDQMSRDHYYLMLELEGGEKESFEVSKDIYEKTPEGMQIKVCCAKGKIFSKRIKALV